MKLCPFQVVGTAVPAAILLLFVSCASKPGDERNTSTAYSEGRAGGTWVESYKALVTVAAVDAADRKVTLVASDNSTNTFTSSSDFQDFDQLRIGSQFQAAVVREMVVFMPQDGTPPAADLTVAKELAKEGKPSGVLRTDTVEKSAKVASIGPNGSNATVQFADGTTKTVSIRSDVKTWNYKVGQTVVIRTRSAAVLNLEKP